MSLKKGIIIFSIFIFFISICGVYSIYDIPNINDALLDLQDDNGPDVGCCSVVLQLEGNSSILSYRRDANSTTDIFIEQVNWHGMPAIKQYKTEYGYFNHVVVTSDGWVIGLGGLDDGLDNEICENITATMINDNYTISEEKLKEIQEIKIQYKKGHVVIKAPNGNYGFATPTKLKTGHLNPGEYISIPNHYNYSRSGEVPLNTSDKINAMADLARSDMYGVSRRGVFIYDINITGTNNTTSIYLSNDDGSLYDMHNLDYIDDVYYNNTVFRASDIPIAPNYKYIGSISYIDDKAPLTENLIILLSIIFFVVFVGILFFVVYKFVRFVRYGKRR